MKTRIFLLFFLLSVTPFMRGCGESFGFPLPALIDIVETDSVLETVGNAVDALGTFEPAALLIANLLIAYLLARIVLAQRARLGWIRPLLKVLAVHLCAIWCMLALFFLPEPNHPLLKKAMEAYGSLYYKYFVFIPEQLTETLIKVIPHGVKRAPGTFVLDPLQGPISDAVSRAYFIVVTSSAAWLLYVIGKKRRRNAERVRE